MRHDLDAARAIGDVLIENAEGARERIPRQVHADVIVVGDAGRERRVQRRLDRIDAAEVVEAARRRVGTGARDAGRGDCVRAAGGGGEKIVAGPRPALSGQDVVDGGGIDVERRGDRELRARDALHAGVEIGGLLSIGHLAVSAQHVVRAAEEVSGIDRGFGADEREHSRQVVEAADVRHLRREVCREDRIVRVGIDLAPVVFERVDRHAERLLGQPDVAFAPDHRRGGPGDVGEALVLEVFPRGIEVLRKRSEARLEFLGGDPLMVER